jgi:hypothetical protein
MDQKLIKNTKKQIFYCDDEDKCPKELFCDICKSNEHNIIRDINTNVCIECINESIWLYKCQNCQYFFNENDSKNCSECGNKVGYCCGAYYFCQSVECICKKCYDYKCNCGADLDSQNTTIFTEENDRCIKCIEKKNLQEQFIILCEKMIESKCPLPNDFELYYFTV